MPAIFNTITNILLIPLRKAREKNKGNRKSNYAVFQKLW